MFAKHYAKCYELFNLDKAYKKEIKFVYKWAEHPNKILDIGCGTADYWRHWPDSVAVLGIEKSKDMIDLSRYKNSIIHGDVALKPIGHKVDLVTALFDVMNYIPEHSWWARLPLITDGFFIFDVLDKEKADKDGFKETLRRIGSTSRRITPLAYDGKAVDLRIEVIDQDVMFEEKHTMYLHSHAEIEQFCGDEFEIVDIKETKTWQKWYKCKKR